MYIQNAFYNPIGVGVWEERQIFDFDCTMTDFANDKIRFLFKLPFDGNFQSRFINTNPEEAKLLDVARLSLSEEESKKLDFINKDNYRQFLKTEYHPELNGVRAYMYLMDSSELKNATLYNGWNFTTTGGNNMWQWDSVIRPSFWYANTTVKLYETDRFVIGAE